MFVVFDLDGTIRDPEQRRHLLPNFNAFEDACENDIPILPVIKILFELNEAGNRVEIWSGCSERVKDKTCHWLNKNGVYPGLLTHMRAVNDYRPDEIIKAEWLNACDPKPDMIFDDRQKVVDMWRANGIVCAQVAPGDFDLVVKPTYHVADGRTPILAIMVGPTCAGKSSWIDEQMKEWIGLDKTCVVSTDAIRADYCDDFKSQTRNKDVFVAAEAIVKLRMQLGLRTIVDATNLKRDWRMHLASLAPVGTTVAYIVIDRPLREKLMTKGWRDEAVIMRHHDEFRGQLAEILAGDHLPNVIVKHYGRY